MIRLYKIPDETKKRIYKNAGEKNNLPPYAIEKDWWVVQILSILYNTEIGEHLVFKGGTSLSKAWDVIERFSEDIDLSVDRTFFGFEGELGKSQRTKLRKTANKYLTEVLFPELKEAFKKAGLKDVKIELEEIQSSDQDPVILNVYYPALIESPGYNQQYPTNFLIDRSSIFHLSPLLNRTTNRPCVSFDILKELCTRIQFYS